MLSERGSSQRSWEDLERTPGEPIAQRHVLPHLQNGELEESECKRDRRSNFDLLVLLDLVQRLRLSESEEEQERLSRFS